ncbi:MAG: PEP-CTERM sorting domain-containing protein [Chlorobiaceae bacterium]|nr:PEP-CTERM sorting domain-containing protein [Chlorobiaceae bacterium]
MSHFIKTVILGIVLLLTGVTRNASATVIYSSDFSSGAGMEWSVNSTAFKNGEYFLADSVYGFGNGTNTLSLTLLPSHNLVTVSFDLYIIQSWDGNGQWGGGADNWQLTSDGGNIFYTNFANYGNGNTQAYTNQLPTYGSGGTFQPRTGAYGSGHLGYGMGDWGDTTYRFSFTYAHSAPTINLAFTSFQNQGASDEGWGLDNVSVSISPDTSSVPEPSSWLLLASGCFGLLAKAWRKTT